MMQGMDGQQPFMMGAGGSGGNNMFPGGNPMGGQNFTGVSQTPSSTNQTSNRNNQGYDNQNSNSQYNMNKGNEGGNNPYNMMREGNFDMGQFGQNMGGGAAAGGSNPMMSGMGFGGNFGMDMNSMQRMPQGGSSQNFAGYGGYPMGMGGNMGANMGGNFGGNNGNFGGNDGNQGSGNNQNMTPEQMQQMMQFQRMQGGWMPNNMNPGGNQG